MKESCRSDLRIERYENRKRRLCFGFQRGEKKEEKKEKKKKGVGRRAADGGDRRQTAATGAGHASTISWSNAAPVRRRHVLPASLAKPRREPTGPADPRLRGGGRAWQARVQPATGASLQAWPRTPSVLLARERAWNGQFGPVVFCFPDFCSGSSSNTVFT